MAYLDRIRACTAHDLSLFEPWYVGADIAGWIGAATAFVLRRTPEVFAERPDGRLAIRPDLDDAAARSAAMATVVDRLIEAGLLPARRGEVYPVLRRWGEAPLLTLDRGAAIPLGVKSYGLHVNGLVRTPGGVELWTGFRAEDRAVAPGKLDHLVAGGQPAGLSLEENLVKESAEEAGVPAPLARTARPVGAVTYTMQTEEGLRRDACFVYDLWVDPDFVPRNSDGEVARFERWPLDRAAETVRDTDRYKFNVALVTIDLLIRRGVIGPDTPDYLEIVRGLRSPTDFPSPG